MLYSDRDGRRELDESNAEQEWRDEVMRDYGRVVHSASFRRLQGKTQVFPGHESDFFRNRLTHSLEVAQIAEGIADRLNRRDPYLKANGWKINSRLCATAALLHDLGHPPFGHNGERALDEMMVGHGGFEGNAQSLRIVSRLEKKVVGPGGRPYGLNLTHRTLAAILKYDRLIPERRPPKDKVAKGYYASEAGLVREVKAQIVGDASSEVGVDGFKSIECSLMDLADDIAYSTFDLEDTLKARLLTPSDMLASSPGLVGSVARKVSEELGRDVSGKAVFRVIQELFEGLIESHASVGPVGSEVNEQERFIEVLAAGQQASNELADSSRLRTKLSSDLVKGAINATSLEPHPTLPVLSAVRLNDEARLRVEVLKQYVYLATVSTPRVKMQEYRGTIIVKGIFEALVGDRGDMLMPDDVRDRYEAAGAGNDDLGKRRVICDFIAGMTDRYASKFYDRLHPGGAGSMFDLF